MPSRVRPGARLPAAATSPCVLGNRECRDASEPKRQDRLAEVERELMVSTSSPSRWVADMLRDFGAGWNGMTSPNRRKLVHALLEEVEVNEPAGTVTVTARFIVSTLGTGGSAGARPSPSPARCTATVRTIAASLQRNRRSPNLAARSCLQGAVSPQPDARANSERRGPRRG